MKRTVLAFAVLLIALPVAAQDLQTVSLTLPVTAAIPALKPVAHYPPADIVFDGPMVNFEERTWVVYTAVQSTPAIVVPHTKVGRFFRALGRKFRRR